MFYYITRLFLDEIGAEGLTLTKLYKISGKVGRRVKMVYNGQRLHAIKYNEDEFQQLTEWLAGLFSYHKYTK